MGGPGGEAFRNGAFHPRAQRHIDDLIRDAVRRRRPICLDSPPLIAYLSEEEPVVSLVAPILEHGDLAVVVSVVTLAEVITPPARSGRVELIDTLRQALLNLPSISFVDFDQDHAVETAIVRAQTSLKLPDAAAVATARIANAIAIIGNDRQWRNRPLGVPYHHTDDILALA